MLIKTLLLKFFKFIKYSLTVIKFHCSPNTRPLIPGFENNECIPYAPLQKIDAWTLFEKDEMISSYNHFRKYFYKSIFLFNKNSILEYALNNSFQNHNFKNCLYLEFGVWTGSSINFISRKIPSDLTIYGFDSFEGIDSDWSGYYLEKGFFNLNKKVPKLEKNVVPVVGLIQKTLPEFLNGNDKKINFMHIDTDIYESAKTILQNTKKKLEKNCIIVFDELYNFPGWSVGEYRALTEVFNEDEYKFLCFAKNGQQAVIQIL